MVWRKYIFVMLSGFLLSCERFEIVDKQIDNDNKNYSQINKTNFNPKQKILFKDKPWVNKNWTKKKINLNLQNAIVDLKTTNQPLKKHVKIINSYGINVNLFDEEKLNQINNKTLVFKGSLKNYIKAIENIYGVQIKIHDKNTINIHYYISKTFIIPIIPGGKKNEKIWKNIETSLKNIIFTNGYYKTQKYISKINVTTDAFTMEKVKKFINETSSHLSTQIIFDVQLFSVSLSNLAAKNLQLNATLINSNQSTLSITSPAQLATSVRSSNLNAKINGSNGSVTGIFEILQGIGKTTLVETASAITTNTAKVPIDLSFESSYISSRNVVNLETSAGNTNNQSYVKIGTEKLKTGFTMSLKPLILDNEKILVEYELNKKDLLSLNNSGTDTDYVQIPNISSRKFVQKIIFTSQKPMIISGYQNSKNTNQTRNGITSNNKKQEETKELFVVIITPFIYKP